LGKGASSVDASSRARASARTRGIDAWDVAAKEMATMKKSALLIDDELSS
jgi:hypothetical protein